MKILTYNMNKWYAWTGAAILSLSLQSCLVRKQMPLEDKRQEVTQDLSVFRIDDYIQKDTTSIAQISWQDYFNDPILKSYIDEMLHNNLDVRVALLNVESAEQYLLQAKSNYAPTLNVSPGATYSTQ